MNYKGIIFDLDGTLTDTLKDVAVCMNAVLENHELPVFPEIEYKLFIGGGLYALIESVVPPALQNAEFNKILAEEFLALYEKNAVVYTKLYPGIPELLTELEEMPIKKGILSNKLHPIVLEVVEKLLSPWRFHSVWGVKPDYPKKPDPACALEIAKELRVGTGEILFVGDSGSDMETAVLAGMVPVGVLWGFRDKAELREHGSAYLLEKPEDLLDIVKKC